MLAGEAYVAGTDRKKELLLYVFIARICIKLTNEKLKLFEFSWDTNRKELRARCHTVMDV